MKDFGYYREVAFLGFLTSREQVEFEADSNVCVKKVQNVRSIANEHRQEPSTIKSRMSGGLAQLVERLLCTEKVSGSTPLASRIKSDRPSSEDRF